MRYAILQKDLNIPPVEQLKRAFRSVKCLTDLDAHTLAKDAYGILVKGLSLGDATTLQGALQTEGVATEIVPEKGLPPLPATKFIHRLDCQPEALIIFDPLGRGFPLEWGHIMMIAAGNVRLNEFKQIRTTRQVKRYSLNGSPYVATVTDTSTKEELNYHLALEIVLSRAVLRYSVTAEKFNFQYLGPRLARKRGHNFASLVQDLIKHAPQAAVNRGAFYLRENAAEVFSYPSKNAFFEEITWLLWRLAQSAAPPAVD